ncbi:MAG: DNA polymerase III subunit delta [Elusimicrobia bacterium]|nr:DNA polymerase III subunit delta [Elusimicrobiota bacterium]
MAFDAPPAAHAKEWAKGAFLPAYYVFGEDEQAKALFVDELKKRLGVDEFNLTELSGDKDGAAAEAVSAAATPPMFSDRRLVVLRRADLGAPDLRIIAEYLRDPLASSVLCMVSPAAWADAKDPAAAAAKSLGGLVTFRPLSDEDAARRLRDEAKRLGFTLEPEAAELMVEESGTEWGVLRSELQKVSLYVQGKGKATPEDAAGCLGWRRRTNVWDFPRAVQRRDAAAAVKMLHALLEEGEDAYSLLPKVRSALSAQLKAKRLLKAGVTKDQAFFKLGLKPRWDAAFFDWAEKVKEPQLVKGLRACLDLEADIKSKSWLDPALELETLVLKACGKG